MKTHKRFALFFYIAPGKIVGHILQFSATKNRKKSHRSVVIMSVTIAFYLLHLTMWRRGVVVPWCSGYHYCTTSFYKAWTQVLRRLKSCSRLVGDSRWWASLTMVPAGKNANRLLSVNHTTKTIHHHHFTPFEFRSA